MTPTKTNLHARAILVNLSIRSWSARKYDKKVTDEINKAHGADADAGRYNKSLMPADAASYKALTQFITAARDRNYEQTLAWNDTGWRLLPIKNFQKYTDQIRHDQHEFDALLEDFVRDYPQLREAARAKLNGMYDEDDYPADIRSRFGFSYSPKPVPQEGDYRVELSQEEIAVLTDMTEANVRAALADAQNDAVKRLYEVVEKMHKALSTVNVCKKCEGSGKTTETRKVQLRAIEEALTANNQIDEIGKPVEVTCWICDGSGQTETTFRDTLIENVIAVCDALKNLNLADDPKLERLRKDTARITRIVTPQTLRDDAAVRESTANEAQSILDAMTEAYGANLFAS